jgi:hypothetical protein
MHSLVGAHRFEESDCMNDMNYFLDQLHDKLSQLSNLVAISSSMTTANDEATVIGYLRINVTCTMRHLPLARLLEQLSRALRDERDCRDACAGWSSLLAGWSVPS